MYQHILTKELLNSIKSLQINENRNHWIYKGETDLAYRTPTGTRKENVYLFKKEGEAFIIDTKWKKIKKGKPSTDDLRQMYVYNDYWKSDKAMLLYPSNESSFNGFVPYEENSSTPGHHECGIGKFLFLIRIKKT